VDIPYQKQTRIPQCGDFAACGVRGTIIDHNDFIVRAQLRKNRAQLHGDVAFALVSGNAY
jgi:hypothetical protein